MCVTETEALQLEVVRPVEVQVVDLKPFKVQVATLTCFFVARHAVPQQLEFYTLAVHTIVVLYCTE